MTVETPQPLWQASRADRMTLTYRNEGEFSEEERGETRGDETRRRSEGTNVSSGIESEVESSIGDINEVLSDSLSLGNVGERVDELSGSELESDLLLRRVGVDGDDSSGLLGLSSLEESETDATSSEDGDGGVL